jgi:hypothetical protein
MTEREWVSALQPRLQAKLQCCNEGDWQIRVGAGDNLRYSCEILSYNEDDPAQYHDSKYETDLLLWDHRLDKERVPRVVIECKLGGVTTHDALTYSAKAATHKHVHPYLRYGILVGKYGGTSLPGRLIRHGAYFDFMMVWEAEEPSDLEWKELTSILAEEVRASRTLLSLLTDSRSRGRKAYRLLHRRLEGKEP